MKFAKRGWFKYLRANKNRTFRTVFFQAISSDFERFQAISSDFKRFQAITKHIKLDRRILKFVF